MVARRPCSSEAADATNRPALSCASSAILSKVRMLVSSRTRSRTWKEARATERALSSTARFSLKICSLFSSFFSMDCRSSSRRCASSSSTRCRFSRCRRSFSCRPCEARWAFSRAFSSAASAACCARFSASRTRASSCCCCCFSRRSAARRAFRICFSSRLAFSFSSWPRRSTICSERFSFSSATRLASSRSSCSRREISRIRAACRRFSARFRPRRSSCARCSFSCLLSSAMVSFSSSSSRSCSSPAPRSSSRALRFCSCRAFFCFSSRAACCSLSSRLRSCCSASSFQRSSLSSTCRILAADDSRSCWLSRRWRVDTWQCHARWHCMTARCFSRSSWSRRSSSMRFSLSHCRCAT
ncbi:hypothetical protein CRUP_004586 [Coryphaenoides rupestris]|nr:hypothetical protein CRUP_004586 [Coryphaenoides rupestris]